ncbi:TetR/AcrR family transcriptional regulator [Paraconexibacter sp.]|uniref:TetR/AcrR family transcriptional regulator n=1 Tax=Paraconexibacter sp. TaxID=2949640 RepID=UPI0035622EC3
MANTPAKTRTSQSDRRARTRQSLLDAGRRLIAEKGVAALRISEITAEADVALGSFYNYFATKEDLVDAVVGDTLRNVAEALAIRQHEDQDSAEIVARAIQRFVAIAYEDPDFASLLVHLSHSDELMLTSVSPPATRAVAEGMESGRFKVTPETLDVIVTIISGGSLSLMRAIVTGRIGPGAEVVFAEHALRMLGIPPSRAAQIVRRIAADTGT